MPKRLPRPAVLQRFGRLRVIIPEGRKINRKGNKNNGYAALCLCDCGALTAALLKSLYNGSKSSCGCFHKDQVRAMFTKHGMKDSPEYGVWCGMKNRCKNPSHKDWSGYGGRGIKVCDRWANDFGAFYSDMGPRPSDKHSIERSDTNGDYEPVNCYWATLPQQARNKRNNVWVKYQGQRMTQADAARASGLSGAVLHKRRKLGITGDALFAPSPQSSRKQAPARLSEDLTGLDDQKSSNPETLEQLRLWDSAA